MKLFAMLLLAVLTACASSRPDQSTVLRGRLASQAYTLPSGEEAQSVVLHLRQPILVAGLARPVTLVEATLPERYFVSWRNFADEAVEVRCDGPVYAASLWGQPHASCSVATMQAAP